MAIKKGVCKNYGECDLADERKIQEVDSADFVCEECGRPLSECEGGNKKTTAPNPKKKFLIAGIAGLAVIGGGIAAIFGLSGKDTPDGGTIKNVSLSKSQDSLVVGNNDTLKAFVSPIGVTSTLKWASSDTTVLKVENGIVTAVGEGNAKIGVQVQENKELKAFCSYTVTKADIIIEDSIVTEVEDTISSKLKENKKKSLPSQNGNVTNMSVSNGKYTGPIKNGKPHGLGKLVFTRTAVINRSDSKQRTAQAGEYVQGQFVNGTFTIGKHYDAYGNLIQSLNFGVAN
jgi:ssDNA-binding Zn-finger/Zn-ribbon topoisomerase 1